MAIDLRAAALVSSLLETEGVLRFHHVLDTGEGTLELQDVRSAGHDEAMASLDITWTAEIWTQAWGIRDIDCNVDSLVLDGWFQDLDADGDLIEGATFRFEFPEKKEAADVPVGSDPDAATPGNVLRLATPRWKVSWEMDKYREDRPRITPTAIADFRKYTLKILF